MDCFVLLKIIVFVRKLVGSWLKRLIGVLVIMGVFFSNLKWKVFLSCWIFLRIVWIFCFVLCFLLVDFCVKFWMFWLVILCVFCSCFLRWWIICWLVLWFNWFWMVEGSRLVCIFFLLFSWSSGMFCFSSCRYKWFIVVLEGVYMIICLFCCISCVIFFVNMVVFLVFGGFCMIMDNWLESMCFIVFCWFLFSEVFGLLKI